MKLRLSSFNALLIGGYALLMFLLWGGSLMVLTQWHNRDAGTTLQNNLRLQVQQLQQNQQLWLQSQYYLLNTLARSPDDNQNFQSFLWGYYQRNPNIWAVNLVQFDERGHPVSKSDKPGCLQPDQMLRYRFDDFLVPRISSCRIDDKALLEIAGPVVADGDAMMLLISMDYFDFLKDLHSLTGRRMQRAADSEERFQYYEFGASENDDSRITIPVGYAGAVTGDLHLKHATLSPWSLFQSQAAVMALLLLLAAAALLALLHVFLVKPLRVLAGKMRVAAYGHLDEAELPLEQVETGLPGLFEYFELMQQTTRLDPVTGLNNRVIFEDRLVQAMREGKRSGRKHALVLVGVRGLGELAQERGQYIVDVLLRQVADGLRESLRESDHVSRFERNLFALLLEVHQIEQLNNLVEKVYLSLIRRYRVHGRELALDAFIGIAVYPDHAVDADGLYQNASTALVEAEHSEWPIRFYQDEADENDVTGFTMIQSLRRAIDRDELKLVYQPVVDLEGYETQYLEALLRWKDPDMHEASIEEIIRLAEQSHLIKSLTNWIIDSACRFLSQPGMEDVAVGINLSMIDLHDRRLPERIETYLEDYGIKPSQIVAEITEGQIMQDPEEVIDVLARLGAMGLSLSIDDFGTGQASLTYLKELPVEKLKIDQSFVRDIVTNPDDQLIVRATIELAHTLDLKVVAEGVETLAVYRMLTEMNCDHVQGYYISRPLEADQVSRWLDTSTKPDIIRPKK